jgi:hypothetical protein
MRANQAYKKLQKALKPKTGKKKKKPKKKSKRKKIS